MTAEDLFLRAYPAIAAAVRVRAREVVVRCRLPAHEREDCEQILLLAVFLALQRYDEEKSAVPTFVDRVSKRKALSMVRDRSANKFRVQEQWVSEIADLLVDTASDPVHVELRRDVAQVVSSLPPEIRRVAELAGTATIAEIAEVLGTSRVTLYARLKSARKILSAVGLGRYLTDPRPR